MRRCGAHTAEGQGQGVKDQTRKIQTLTKQMRFNHGSNLAVKGAIRSTPL